MTSSPSPDSASPIDEATELVDPPGFAPRTPPQPDPWQGGTVGGAPLPPTSSATSTATIDDDAPTMGPTIDELDDEDYYDELDDPSSSTPPPTTPSRAYTADPRAFEQLIGVALGMGGLALHQTLTPGPDNNVWMLDEDDTRDIAGPLSRIVARRVPMRSGREANDVSDAIEAGVALAGYGIKNYAKLGELRTQRATTPTSERAPDGYSR